MVSAEICKIVRTCLKITVSVIFVFHITGCSKEITEQDYSKENAFIRSQNSNEEIELKLYFDDTEIPVTWENNDTVGELIDETANGDIVVAMSMYGGNEQVGSLGRSYKRNDRQMTTYNGDIVLYNGNQIVVFYGSNSWAYTKLGKIDLSEEDVVDLLSKSDITLTIKR